MMSTSACIMYGYLMLGNPYGKPKAVKIIGTLVLVFLNFSFSKCIDFISLQDKALYLLAIPNVLICLEMLECSILFNKVKSKQFNLNQLMFSANNIFLK